MTKLNFRFEWYDDAQTVMRYVLEGHWNWRDYHAGVRASIFSMHQHPHKVDSLIDLRESTRPTMPGGLAAHASAFGKRLTPALSGNAVVLGLPADALQQLPLNDDGTMSTRDGRVYFASDEAQANALLAQLRALNEAE